MQNNTGSITVTAGSDLLTEGTELLRATLYSVDSIGTQTGGLTASININDTSTTPTYQATIYVADTRDNACQQNLGTTQTYTYQGDSNDISQAEWFNNLRDAWTVAGQYDWIHVLSSNEVGFPHGGMVIGVNSDNTYASGGSPSVCETTFFTWGQTPTEFAAAGESLTVPFTRSDASVGSSTNHFTITYVSGGSGWITLGASSLSQTTGNITIAAGSGNELGTRTATITYTGPGASSDDQFTITQPAFFPTFNWTSSHSATLTDSAVSVPMSFSYTGTTPPSQSNITFSDVNGNLLPNVLFHSFTASNGTGSLTVTLPSNNTAQQKRTNVNYIGTSTTGSVTTVTLIQQAGQVGPPNPGDDPGDPTGPMEIQ